MAEAPTGSNLDPTRARNQARRQFEAWADTYDQSLLNRFLFRPCYLLLLEELARWHRRHQRAFRVLDVGCGTGTLALMVAASRLPASVVGLDYAPAMCAEATRKAADRGATQRTRFLAGDSEHLPFADETFDLITCSNSFHHYPDQQAVVTGMRRLLRPGGRLIILDGFRDTVVGWFVFDVIIARVEKDVFHAPWPAMHDYFVKAGLTNIRRRKINFWFPVLATMGDVE
ncbi:MAG: class I SAM-dependent methyltransferase [bacterium]|nr:class I SAM-dependent methyltransferase [bacterium]